MSDDDDEDVWALLESEPSGFLETPPPDVVIGLANGEAAAGLTAWLTAMGLAAEIDHVRLQEEGRIVPAPGLDVLKDGMEHAARAVHEGAETVVRLATAGGSTHGVGRWWPGRAQPAIHRYVEVRDASRGAQLGLRRLSQLALAVAALTLGGDRIERLERGAVAVLHPPSERVSRFDEGRAYPLYEDEPRLFSTTQDELVVEVAGILCRLLLDRSSTARFATPAGQIFFLVEGDTLIGSVKPPDAAVQAWSERDLAPTVSWDSPVTVSKPARVVAETLVEVLGLDPVNTLALTYGKKRQGSGASIDDAEGEPPR